MHMHVPETYKSSGEKKQNMWHHNVIRAVKVTPSFQVENDREYSCNKCLGFGLFLFRKQFGLRTD